ncbi:MAG TPA: hypothetical protein VKF42_10860 [Chitinivibrionales bacterium]|jgi:photosystem II stability/assembly factor-like uncharacterized protein|nr:hypothetical protein [Chitinivibrionales bacterium]
MNVKHLCGFAAGVCLLLVVSSQAAPDWVQQTSHTLATLGGISFLDENTGFITGDSGVVLKTKDGGATWTRLYAGPYGLMDVHAVDSNLLYISVAKGGKVIKSADGGGTWTIQNVENDSTDRGMAIWFTSPLKGFVCIGKYPFLNSRIFGTVDGGLTWNAVYTTTAWISYLSFPDAAHGFATSSAGGVVTTTDSGATWTSSPTGQALFLSGVSFVNDDTGYVGGIGGVTNNRYTNVNLLKTTDGGTTWSTVNTVVVAIRMWFVDDSTGYLVGGDSILVSGTDYTATNFRLMKTQDGGTTWQRIDLGVTSDINGVCFPSASVGYAAGSNGTVFKYQAPTAVLGKQNQLMRIACRIYAAVTASGELRISYTLPANTGDVGFAMYNVKGACVWKRVIGGSRSVGVNTAAFEMDARVPAGMYMLTMSSGLRTIAQRMVSWLP